MTKNKSNPPDDGGHETEVQVEEDSRTLDEAVEDHERAIGRRDFGKGAVATTLATTFGVGNVSGQSSDEGWIDGLVSGADVVIGEAADNIDWSTAGIALASGPVGAGYFAGRTAVDVLQELGDNPGVNTIHDAIYNDAILSEKDVVEAINSAQQEIEQTAGLARAEGKSVAFKAISNGKTESTASTKATARIEEYFAAVKEAFFRAQEAQVLQIEQYVTTVESTTNLSISDVINLSEDVGKSVESVNGVTFSDVDVTLADDRTITLRRGHLDMPSATSSDFYYYGESAKNTGMQFDYFVSVEPSYTLDSNSDLAQIAPTASAGNNWGFDLQYNSYPDIVSKIDTARNNAQSDVSTIISDVFANYTQEQLSNVDEFISPFQRTLLSSEDYTETGAPVYPQMVSNELGIPTSQAGYSLTIEYEASTGAGTDGNTGTSDDTFGSVQTLDGTLWGFKPSSGDTLSSGSTYLTRADNSAGTVAYFSEVQDDGSVSEVKLDGRFTITSIQTRDGSEVDTVGTYDATLQSPDTSNLIDQFQKANDRRQEEDESAPTSPGGGGSGGANEALRNLGIVGAIIAVVYGILTRDDD